MCGSPLVARVAGQPRQGAELQQQCRGAGGARLPQLPRQHALRSMQAGISRATCCLLYHCSDRVMAKLAFAWPCSDSRRNVHPAWLPAVQDPKQAWKQSFKQSRTLAATLTLAHGGPLGGMAHRNIVVCSLRLWVLLRYSKRCQSGQQWARLRAGRKEAWRRTRCKFTQDNGMPDGVSNAGISRSARSTAFVSKPSRYPAGRQQWTHAIGALVN